MTIIPHDRTTLRAACEGAIERAQGKTCQPLVLLPAAMVVELLDMAELAPAGVSCGTDCAPPAVEMPRAVQLPGAGGLASASPGLFARGEAG